MGRAAAHFGLGATAGIAATLASYPFDVVRTRLVAQGNERAYAGTVDAAGKMWRAEGARAFFRGLVPTLATVGPYSGLQFGFYALFNQIFDPVLSSGRISMSKSVLCGGLAGFCAKIAVFPFDTTKKRLQVQVQYTVGLPLSHDVFFWKFRLPIGLHSSWRISPMAGRTSSWQKYTTERTPRNAM